MDSVDTKVLHCESTARENTNQSPTNALIGFAAWQLLLGCKVRPMRAFVHRQFHIGKAWNQLAVILVLFY